MNKNKWYFSLWFIAIMFALWFFIIPLIIGIVLLIRFNKVQNENHKKLKELEAALLHRANELLKNEQEMDASWIDLKKNKNETSEKLLHMQKKISGLQLAQQLRMIHITKAEEEEMLKSDREINRQKRNLEEIKRQIHYLEKKKIDLEDEVSLQSFGFYDNKFFLVNSQEYLSSLELVREKQKQMIKERRAADYDILSIEENRVTPGSLKSKQQMTLSVRSFINECDNVISRVKFNTVELGEKKIRTSFYDINKLNSYNSIFITEEFLHLKLEELFLVHEYAEKKHEEKEEQRRINDLIREEKRVQKELEEELTKIKKEEQHLLNAISNLSSQISKDEMLQYKKRLEEINIQKAHVDYRVKNTRAGYVYIISNLGCFGEDVYKIGMTRRLEPMDRIKELGAASVPFHFDVHAMIFSDDAPSLEATLHRTFAYKRVNKMNERKEFFRVTLEEIREIVHQNHNAYIEFTMLAQAKEYRETQMLEKQQAYI
ncbi:DUF4041 domain-containing protein [Metabacillus idriensis]|uniref:DUF4041 domain-containing protein n=1 Tax=Metabacillus idriensis TaxID=324768 RepID=UPI0020422D40|nr:DUF4041 domain-containing protein [Metabacillus idriensis]MCM3597205.1 DUF4041 domain-containing protein [Metabacillus idriensis]